jgi:purine-cytosine permease-like protein
MMSDWGQFCFTSVVFGAIASLTAYMAFYHEYLRLTTRGRARSLALQGAVTAFVFFVGLAVASGYVKSHLVVWH